MIWFRRPPPADLAVFHLFAPPPTGGGHQFMRALCRALESRGLRLAYNRLPPGTPACLCNSYNFDLRALERALRRQPGTRCVHRIDGPLQTYRGFDDGTDARISAFNRAHAHATIVQSAFSLRAHRELGLSAHNPHLIPNTPDPAIFHPPAKRPPHDPSRPLRVVAVSWSDNPNKGLETYRWLDEHLDLDAVDFTFVGRIQAELKRVRTCPPLGSEALAELLRAQDVYLTASRNDPCSNSLLEALACGLPAVFLDSGGHPEIVKDAGLPFREPAEIPALLDRLRHELPAFRDRICVPSLDETADAYLRVLFPSGT